MSLKCYTGKMRDSVGCVNCEFRKESLFSELFIDDLEKLENGRKVIHVRKGEKVYESGTKPKGLLCLKKGKLKITRIGVEGIEQIVGLKKPVDFVGYRSLISQREHPNSAVAIEDATLCLIEREPFLEVLSSGNGLALKILRSFASELLETEGRIVNLSQKHMRGRMAEAILILIDIFGFKKDGQTLDVSLKRAELGALANMTTANAIRILSAFAKENVIILDKRKIIIPEQHTLRNISELNL